MNETSTQRVVGRRDRLFADERTPHGDFDFGPATAAVFDDMLDRSVPFYGEIQRMIAELAAEFAAPGSRVVDLGCSTGNSLLAMDSVVPRERRVRFLGIDASEAMLVEARRKLAGAGVQDVELRCADLERSLDARDVSVALLVLTLQFVAPEKRPGLLAEVFRSLQHEGCLILVEKVQGTAPVFDRLFRERYHALKRRNGYSDLEIARKREALENVLIPVGLDENRAMLREAGFARVDVFFKWYGFCGLLAVK